MRLSEDKVKEVRAQFTALAEKQADIFCTAYETFAQQLPSFINEEQVEAMFNEMLSAVQAQYTDVLGGIKAGIDEKLKDKDYINSIVEEVKSGGRN